MSIPKQFVDQVRARASLYTFARSRVRFDPSRSKPERGQYWACCPFHSEKTPSFSIDDRKGLYHCFGCGASGNTFRFVQKVANVSFPEAVRMLAVQEGMSVPSASPAETQQAEQSARLFRVNQLAAEFFTNALNTAAGKEARRYLREVRGLSAEIVEQFGLGYAPNAKQELRRHLSQAGVSTEDMHAAGLIGIPEKGNEEPYDFFRHRIMFPIHRPGGDILGFGGRALSPQARAKYMNTRDTPIFKKGNHLYWFGPACEAARSSDTLYVAEGYMDVIAMVAGGFPNTVAPLGTALRVEQLRMAFQRAPRVIVAFDGDAAGINAATRTAQSALAELQPGQELKFAVLPSGTDPDDYLKQYGQPAMQELLDGAQPVWRLLWSQASQLTDFGNPSSVAALRKRIDEVCDTIQNPILKNEYRGFLRDRAFRQSREAREQEFQSGSGTKSRSRADAALRLQATPLTGVRRKGEYNLPATECGILCALACNPGLLEDFIDELGEMQFDDAKLETLRGELVGATFANRQLDELAAEFQKRLGPFRKRYLHLDLLPCLHPERADPAAAKLELENLIADYRRKTQGRSEIALAVRQLNEGTASQETDESLRRIAETLTQTEGDDSDAPQPSPEEVEASQNLQKLAERLAAGEV